MRNIMNLLLTCILTKQQTKKRLMILETTILKIKEKMILKDKFNLTATDWQFYGKIIVRKNQSDTSDQFIKGGTKCQKKIIK